jgi:hypothetical protein
MRCRATALLAVAVLGAAACSTVPDRPVAGTTGTLPPRPSSAPPSPPATSTPATPATGTPPVLTPLLARAVAEPIPVPATDGKVHLAYELELTNSLPQNVTLTAVTVRGGDRTLLNLPGDQVAQRTRLLGSPVPTAVIGPAQSAYVWLDVAVPTGQPVPERLVHDLGISVAQPQPPLLPATMTEAVATVAVQTRRPVVISPPLVGPSWLDGDGCCGLSAHRTAMNPIDGQVWAAERFAIDYVQLQPDGRLLSGPRDQLTSYRYFGADVHAVADGPVVAVVDGLPEQIPGASPTGLRLDQYGGNHIVQDLGNGNYAFYAHLKTGSITVRPGDRLTRGQVVASVGNSGNTDAPHLHFHVMSTPDPLRSDGLPFVLDTFRLDAHLAGSPDTLFDGTPAALESGVTGRPETRTSPLDGDVMTYAAP